MIGGMTRPTRDMGIREENSHGCRCYYAILDRPTTDATNAIDPIYSLNPAFAVLPRDKWLQERNLLDAIITPIFISSQQHRRLLAALMLLVIVNFRRAYINY